MFYSQRLLPKVGIATPSKGCSWPFTSQHFSIEFPYQDILLHTYTEKGDCSNLNTLQGNWIPKLLQTLHCMIAVCFIFSLSHSLYLSVCWSWILSCCKYATVWCNYIQHYKKYAITLKEKKLINIFILNVVAEKAG